MELREPRSDRWRRLLAVVIGVIVAIAAASFLLRIAERRGAPSCAEAYAAARTAADTALVDAQGTGAATGRLDAAYNASCGELRLRGQLR
jgi:hypothetical protein